MEYFSYLQLKNITYYFIKILLLFIFCFLLSAKGQEEKKSLDEQFDFTKQRPVFFEYGLDFLGEYDITTNSTQKSEAEVEFTRRNSFKLNFPIYDKKSFHFAGGLRYYNQQFKFENLDTSDIHIQKKLDDPLNRFGIRLYFLKTRAENRSIFASLSFDLKTERPIGEDFSRNYLKTSFTLLSLHEKNSHTKTGFGLGFGYEWGKPLLIPLYYYTKRYSPKWDIEMTLPKSIQLRYAYSSKLYIKSKLEVTGGSYTLVEETIEGYNHLEIRQSEISLSLKIEMEIHDWLWMAVRTGFLYSYKMNIVEPDLFNDKELVTTDPFTNYFIGIKLFVVPPRKMLEKYFK
jgi:hypothetical protein